MNTVGTSCLKASRNFGCCIANPSKLAREGRKARAYTRTLGRKVAPNLLPLPTYLRHHSSLLLTEVPILEVPISGCQRYAQWTAELTNVK